MQKSKISTLIIIVIIILFTILKFTILQSLNTIYVYIINPLFWFGLSTLLYFLLGKTYGTKKLKSEVIQYTLIAVLVYIIIYLLSGLFVGFGRNPYSQTVRGVLSNVLAIGIPIIFREYVRFKLINNVNDKDKKIFFIIIVLIFTLIEFEIWKLLINKHSTFYILEQIFKYFVPMLATNILATYLASNKKYEASIVYLLGTNMFLWLAPILPNIPWIIKEIIDTATPTILILYIMYSQNVFDRFTRNRKVREMITPRNIIPLVLVIMLSVWFAIGVFPIRPITIYSGSMVPELYKGDIVVVKKCNINDVNVGDIIEYKMNEKRIIHRIIEKKQTNGVFYMKTKGDHNEIPDKEYVTEEHFEGKVIFKVKYLGYPSIWISELRNSGK